MSVLRWSFFGSVDKWTGHCFGHFWSANERAYCYFWRPLFAFISLFYILQCIFISIFSSTTTIIAIFIMPWTTLAANPSTGPPNQILLDAVTAGVLSIHPGPVGNCNECGRVGPNAHMCSNCQSSDGSFIRCSTLNGFCYHNPYLLAVAMNGSEPSTFVGNSCGIDPMADAMAMTRLQVPQGFWNTIQQKSGSTVCSTIMKLHLEKALDTTEQELLVGLAAQGSEGQSSTDHS